MDTAFPCPNCGHSIELSESLAKPMLAKMQADYEAKLLAKDKEMAKKAKSLANKEKAVAEAEHAFELKVQEQLSKERAEIIKKAEENAALRIAQDSEARAKELESLKTIVAERDEKLRLAQQQQLDAAKKSRELEDKIREQDLKVEAEIQKRSDELRQKAQMAAEEALSLKVTEKDETIASLAKQIEELKRKAEQGSQQLQGEAQEIQLEEWLKTSFLFDQIMPVPKGVQGGDVIQAVHSTSGILCGHLIWEAKRTKNFSPSWLAKLRDDQRSAKADLAILVTQTLPTDISGFGQKEGVWVCEPHFALPLATALRHGLIEVSKAKGIKEGQQSKMAIVYDYLTGSEFTQRIEAIVDHFSAMQIDLMKERQAMERIWARREKQINGVLGATTGLYGDLQGIAGSAIPHIDKLELDDLSQDTANSK